MDLLDLVSSDDNIQSRLSDMSPSSFIREKLSDVKCMFEEAKLLFTNSISPERLNSLMTLHSSMIFKVFQLTSLPRFGYILSLKKRPGNVH